jgi:hypothetical protein
MVVVIVMGVVAQVVLQALFPVIVGAAAAAAVGVMEEEEEVVGAEEFKLVIHLELSFPKKQPWQPLRWPIHLHHINILNYMQEDHQHP